jgi:hypothetical protein
MNALFCWKESAIFAVFKNSVKAISDIIETPYFQKNFVRLMNDIKSFDFGPMQKCPFWPMRPSTFEMLPRPLDIFCHLGLTTFTLSLKKERKPFKDRELPSLLSYVVAY